MSIRFLEKNVSIVKYSVFLVVLRSAFAVLVAFKDFPSEEVWVKVSVPVPVSVLGLVLVSVLGLGLRLVLDWVLDYVLDWVSNSVFLLALSGFVLSPFLVLLLWSLPWLLMYPSHLFTAIYRVFPDMYEEGFAVTFLPYRIFYFHRFV